MKGEQSICNYQYGDFPCYLQLLKEPNQFLQKSRSEGVLGVDGLEIRQTHQLMLVVYPHCLQGVIHPRWW